MCWSWTDLEVFRNGRLPNTIECRHFCFCSIATVFWGGRHELEEFHDLQDSYNVDIWCISIISIISLRNSWTWTWINTKKTFGTSLHEGSWFYHHKPWPGPERAPGPQSTQELGNPVTTPARPVPSDVKTCGHCSIRSIDGFKGKITGKSHISWENLWFPVKIFP